MEVENFISNIRTVFLNGTVPSKLSTGAWK